MRGGTASPGRFSNTGDVPSLLCRDFFVVNNGHSLVLLSTWHTARVASDPDGSSHTGILGVRVLSCGLYYNQFPLRFLCGDGFSDVLTAYGLLVSGRKCFLTQRYLVRQWILVASVYGLCLATETGARSENCAWFWCLCPFTPLSDEGARRFQRWYGFAGYSAHRAGIARYVLLVVGRPKVFGIMVVVVRKPCTSPWRSHRSSSWTSLTCPLCSETGTFSAVCVQTVEIPQVQYRPWRSRRCSSWLCY